ncbi:MAG: ABC transporter ATP-binding protein [Cellulosilyticaceae bacterium]
MIKVANVSKAFGKFQAVDQVSLAVSPGTIHGLIGENGAGKTTFIQCLVGIYKADQGQILIDEQPVWENEKAKEHIGYVADRNQYFKGYRVSELVDFYEMLYPNFSRQDFERYNQIFKIKPQSKVTQLSKGMQMRVSFMLGLASNPKVMVLDEPTSGLDAIAKKQLLDLLLEAVEEKGMTVVISSHHLTELERICDEVTFIHQGKVAYQSTIDDLKSSVKKLQVVFEGEAPVGFEAWPEFVNVERIGSVYYAITDHYSQALEVKIKEGGARIVEPIGMNLEEIFVYTNGGAREVQHG